jgi:chromosomal replication initiation ATPase DnaA
MTHQKSRFKNVYAFKRPNGNFAWRVKVKINGAFENCGVFPYTEKGERDAAERAKNVRDNAKANAYVETVIKAIKAGFISDRLVDELKCCVLSAFELEKLQTRYEMDVIAYHTCKYFNITLEQLKEPSRKRETAYKRQVAQQIMYSNKHTFDAIGKFFNQDHTTIIYSVNVMKGLIDVDKTAKIDTLTILNNIDHAQTT